MILLRSYQSDMIEEARDHMRRGLRRILLVAPTGTGKRIIAVNAIETAVSRGKRCGFLVHRQELLDQSSATLTEEGVPHGIIKAGVRPDYDRLCQVASVQSLVRRRDVPRFDFLFCDEAHHAPATTWRAVMEAQPEAYTLGFTATPVRHDDCGLAGSFQEMVVGPGMRWMIDQGYLSDYRLYAPPPPDLTGVHSGPGGDYARAELDAVMGRPRIIGDIVEHYLKYAPHTQALCFAAGIKSSKEFVIAFQQRGVKAMHADGETPKEERRQILRDFEAGRFQVLCSVDIVGEGLDVAGIEAIIGARPTKSLTVCLQQWGRGLRVKPSGQPCILLDHAGNFRRHGLPDDDRAWVLTEDKVKLPVSEVQVATCPKCFMVLPADTVICPGCGTQLRSDASTGEGVGRGVEHLEGELVAVDTLAARRAAKIERRGGQTLEELEELARERGYKRGWAYHVWKARGGQRRGSWT